MLSNALRLNVCNLKMCSGALSTLSSKSIWHVLKNKQKNKSICIYEIKRLIIMNMKVKMKNRSHRYDTSRPRSRHGPKYGKCEECLFMMLLIYPNQHLSNI